MKVPFIIYGDFEAVLKPHSTCNPNPDDFSTTITHTHEPYSFAYYIKYSFDSSLNKLELYRGPDAAKVFIQRLEKDAVRLHQILNTVIPMKPLTSSQNVQFESATKCFICGDNLSID